jgi:thymidylate kinase
MLIIDGTIGSNISAFLARLNEETLPCTIMLYQEWLATHSSHTHCNSNDNHPQGIIYIRVMPEIALKRISPSNLTLEKIQQIYQQKNEQFIENKNNSKELQDLPVLVLNGNIDFQTDFSQFYSHLFYIKRFLNQIQERKEIALGIYKKKSPQQRCC